MEEISWINGSYKSYPWLKAFCFYCRSVKNLGMLTFSSKAETTFTREGFNNWNKTIEVMLMVRLF